MFGRLVMQKESLLALKMVALQLDTPFSCVLAFFFPISMENPAMCGMGSLGYCMPGEVDYCKILV